MSVAPCAPRLPHLNRDSIWRILKAEGLNRRPKPFSERPAKGQGSFRDYDLGFIHIDIKHLPCCCPLMSGQVLLG